MEVVVGDYYVGEIRIFPYILTPKNWLRCEGQLLEIRQYNALFALLGFKYGGNNSTHFNIPDLRGRTPISHGTDPRHLSFNYAVGNAGGQEEVALDIAQMPAHNHTFRTSTTVGTASVPAGNYFGASGVDNYTNAPHDLYGPPPAAYGNLVPLINTSINTAGGGGKHNNIQPSMVMNFCICHSGSFPPHNN